MSPPQLSPHHHLVVSYNMPIQVIPSDTKLTQLLQRLESEFATNTAARVHAPHLLEQLENLNIDNCNPLLSSTALSFIAAIISIRAFQAAESANTTIASEDLMIVCEPEISMDGRARHRVCLRCVKSRIVVLTGDWEEKYEDAVKEGMERVVKEGVELVERLEVDEERGEGVA
jgi:hypothetical protein